MTSWRETYAGLLPDQILNGLSAEAQTAMWSRVLGDPASFGGAAIFVAENEDALTGFGACGGQRDGALKERGFDGEIGAVYVPQSHQRAGVGNALMRLMAEKLLDQGRRAATLWVLRENLSARAFYERLDGAIVDEKEAEQSGSMPTEVAYGWCDLSRLIR